MIIWKHFFLICLRKITQTLFLHEEVAVLRCLAHHGFDSLSVIEHVSTVILHEQTNFASSFLYITHIAIQFEFYFSLFFCHSCFQKLKKLTSFKSLNSWHSFEIWTNVFQNESETISQSIEIAGRTLENFKNQTTTWHLRCLRCSHQSAARWTQTVKPSKASRGFHFVRIETGFQLKKHFCLSIL